MVSTLSGGQQRRVLIARALAGRPEVLIMDEPTAGVDVESQDALVRTLVSLVDRGLTLLIVTHEIAPLRPVLNRVVTMNRGRLVRDVTVSPNAVSRGAVHGAYPTADLDHTDLDHTDLDHTGPER
jgi:zinc transport system ATP-binding protein